MSARKLPEHTPHVCSHRGGCPCCQLWTQCVGCQSSWSGSEKAFSIGEGTFQCTFMACASATLWSCIDKIFLKPTGQMMHTTCSYVMWNLCSNSHGAPVNCQVPYVHCMYQWVCVGSCYNTLWNIVTFCGNGWTYYTNCALMLGSARAMHIAHGKLTL